MLVRLAPSRSFDAHETARYGYSGRAVLKNKMAADRGTSDLLMYNTLREAKAEFGLQCKGTGHQRSGPRSEGRGPD